MVITHNLISLNTLNNFNKASNSKTNAIEKLSSGYRINRASDNAAGLCISEKMRGQIRGLEQASRNAQDGISLLQTAEGGMNEIHSILQRCRELSVQSANGTYTDEDRKSMQDEVKELTKEVDAIANDTEFNSMSILCGKYKKDGSLIQSSSLDKYVQYVTTSGGLDDIYTYGGISYTSAMIDFSNINSASDVANLVDKGVSYTCCTCNKTYSIKFVNGTPDTSRLNASDPVMEIDVSSITNGTDLANKIIETAYGQPGFVYNPISKPDIPVIGTDVPSNATSFVTHYAQLAVNGAVLYIYDDRPENYAYIWPDGNGSGEFNLYVYGEGGDKEDMFSFFDIQVGSNSNQSIRLTISNMSSNQLHIGDASVSTQENANLAISKFDDAIEKVSKARSSVGSYQNRLEHAMASCDNTSENLQNAESRIRDADIATEMVEMSKYNILEQVAQSLLSQSNKFPDRILNLLN